MFTDQSEIKSLATKETLSLPNIYHRVLDQVIISILLEPEVHQLPDGAQLVRALNVLTVKMIDRSDPTAITCAFIRQLRETVGNTGLSQEYTEMVRSKQCDQKKIAKCL